jgi:TatD DNase family protein
MARTGAGTGVLPVAIGETGLDYHYDHSPRDVQRAVFRQHMEMARELDLPAIVHEREATEDSLRLMRDLHAEGRLRPVPGVFHCYGGSAETAKELMRLGFFLSFAGPVTFRNAHRLLDVVRAIPPSRLLVETDCPYLTPVPHRGERNEPAFVALVAETVAALHGLSVETLCGIVRRNAETVFPRRNAP